MYKDLLKSAVTLIASAGVGAVVTNAVKATTPDDLKTANKVVVLIGSMVVAHAVSDLASKYTAEQIDEVGKAGSAFKDYVQTQKKH